MKKVMITISTLYGGGAERVVSLWAKQLSESGYDISIMIYGRGHGEYAVPDTVAIHTVADTYEKYQKMSYVSRLKKMRSIIKNEKPDIMINFLPRMQTWVLLASLMIKTYRIETVRVSPWEVCKDSCLEKQLWKTCFTVADAVILQTREQGEFFSDKIVKKSIVIPNPITEECQKNYRSSFTDKPKNFIAAGRLTIQKNYPMMIKAFSEAYKKNNTIRLSIYGSGSGEADPYPKQLQQMINSLGMNNIIKLEGRTNRIVQRYCENDAFLMTSDFEGMPNSLAEAMACGLLCISTNCKTGPKDMIDDGRNGFLVKVNDIADLTRAILHVANMEPDAASAIGNAARSSILELCSEENSKRKLISLIEHGVN